MRWVTLLIGLVLGVLLLGAVRFARVKAPEGVHFHANWAVFVDGQRLDLTGSQFMEDPLACSVVSGEEVNPRHRVHMHEGIQDVVHVHHAGVTWGHLMNNLRIGFGDDYLILPDGRRLHAGEEGRTFKFIVDGFQVPELQNRPIANEDRVLISVGSETPEDVLATQFASVAHSAHDANLKDDPASCSGSAPHWTFRDRLRHAFWD